MTKIRYIKACPFLRDLGDSFLCVNNDNVVDLVLDPLIHIVWSEELPPVASELEDITTCLFVLEINDDGKLYCISRDMFLQMDNRYILWEDIRDSVFLLNLNESEGLQESEIDFCSTCLYKVLIASSPAFQSKLTYDEKIHLGWSYILNKANEIYNSIIRLSKQLSEGETAIIEKCVQVEDLSESDKKTALSWFSWLTDNFQINNSISTKTFEWLQKFDEWALIVSKAAKENNKPAKIELVKQTQEYGAKLKEISYEIVLELSTQNIESKKEYNVLKKIEKIIVISAVQFEDFTFICSQFLDSL